MQVCRTSLTRSFWKWPINRVQDTCGSRRRFLSREGSRTWSWTKWKWEISQFLDSTYITYVMDASRTRSWLNRNKKNSLIHHVEDILENTQRDWKPRNSKLLELGASRTWLIITHAIEQSHRINWITLKLTRKMLKEIIFEENQAFWISGWSRTRWHHHARDWICNLHRAQNDAITHVMDVKIQFSKFHRAQDEPDALDHAESLKVSFEEIILITHVIESSRTRCMDFYDRWKKIQTSRTRCL